MKYLRIKLDEIPGGSTCDVVRAVLNYPPASGLSFVDIRLRTRLADAVDAAVGRVIAFEDSDAVALIKMADAVKWTSPIPGLVTFRDALDEMPSKLPESE